MTLGWGSGSWGISGWGGSVQGDPLRVESITIWAADQIQVHFNVMACNDEFLQSPSQYVIVPLEIGNSIEVREVRAGADASVSSLFLTITPPTMGAYYRLILQDSLTSADGVPIAPGAYGDFYTRLTKIDTLLSTRAMAYDLRPSAIFRNVINAIGREDDRIGGSQNENI